jgi:hypothetical protein
MAGRRGFRNEFPEVIFRGVGELGDDAGALIVAEFFRARTPELRFN